MAEQVVVEVVAVATAVGGRVFFPGMPLLSLMMGKKQTG